MAVVAFAPGPVVPQPPATPKRPVSDEYGAIKVPDDYRWLENWENPEVKQWSAAQDACTREYLDRLASRPAIKERLYSPYHHVKVDTAYPAIHFLTGDKDRRVNPMESRKMTARLQAASSSDHPIALRTISSAGHGIGTALD
jgi:prolyl oligopeptidase PreP (S9A serine peptidase family)